MLAEHFHELNIKREVIERAELKRQFNELETILSQIAYPKEILDSSETALSQVPYPERLVNLVSWIKKNFPQYADSAIFRAAAWRIMVDNPPKVNELIEAMAKAKEKPKLLTAGERNRTMNRATKVAAMQMFKKKG